jgi:sulfur carrier protein ThiS
MITPESIAIAMTATLAPLIPILVTNMVPVAVAIPGAITIPDAHADTIFTDADANLRCRRQRQGQNCGTYQTKSELLHCNLL